MDKRLFDKSDRSNRMKAYEVMYKWQDWCDFTHAIDSQEARNLFWKAWSGEGEFIEVRARRVPALDDIPLTGANIVKAGFNEEWLTGHTYTCKCGICERQER